jgi:hypothetical protein
MIRYLAMNQTNQLNLFPVKGGVSAYYSPQMLLNQSNIDYNKHCTVPFGAFVQANHETTKTNSNVTRTLDAIYLRPAQNQQGGHELMDLNSGLLITRNIVHEIPVTNVVIQAVEAMAYNQGFTTLKFKNRHGVIFHDADWIAGVDYEENEDNDNADDDKEYDNENEEDDYEEELEQIDPAELDDLISDERDVGNPTIQNGNGTQAEEVIQDDPETANPETATEEEPTRRSTREIRPIERLEPTMSGQSYVQRTKVTFQNEMTNIQLEYCHNLIVQTKPDPSLTKEYDTSDAMLMARLNDQRSIIRTSILTRQRDQGVWSKGARRLIQRD